MRLVLGSRCFSNGAAAAFDAAAANWAQTHSIGSLYEVKAGSVPI